MAAQMLHGQRAEGEGDEDGHEVFHASAGVVVHIHQTSGNHPENQGDGIGVQAEARNNQRGSGKGGKKRQDVEIARGYVHGVRTALGGAIVAVFHSMSFFAFI